jgi:hypothetical protein
MYQPTSEHPPGLHLIRDASPFGLADFSALRRRVAAKSRKPRPLVVRAAGEMQPVAAYCTESGGGCRSGVMPSRWNTWAAVQRVELVSRTAGATQIAGHPDELGWPASEWRVGCAGTRDADSVGQSGGRRNRNAQCSARSLFDREQRAAPERATVANALFDRGPRGSHRVDAKT